MLASWLLNPRDPILPKAIEAIRGVVLKKLQEEADSVNVRGSKSKKKAAEKDVVRGGMLQAHFPAFLFRNTTILTVVKMVLKFRSF